MPNFFVARTQRVCGHDSVAKRSSRYVKTAVSPKGLGKGEFGPSAKRFTTVSFVSQCPARPTNMSNYYAAYVA